MIEFELPCCGATARVEGLADVTRCDDCGIAVDLAPETVAGPRARAAAVVAVATEATALAA